MRETRFDFESARRETRASFFSRERARGRVSRADSGFARRSEASHFIRQRMRPGLVSGSLSLSLSLSLTRCRRDAGVLELSRALLGHGPLVARRLVSRQSDKRTRVTRVVSEGRVCDSCGNVSRARLVRRRRAHRVRTREQVLPHVCGCLFFVLLLCKLREEDALSWRAVVARAGRAGKKEKSPKCGNSVVAFFLEETR